LCICTVFVWYLCLYAGFTTGTFAVKPVVKKIPNKFNRILIITTIINLLKHSGFFTYH